MLREMFKVDTDKAIQILFFDFEDENSKKEEEVK